jgi:hypothetical protein
MKSSRFLKPCTLVVVLILGVMSLSSCSKSLSLAEHATRVLEALKNGDVSTLGQYIPDEEREYAGLDEASLKSLLGWHRELWGSLPGVDSEPAFEESVAGDLMRVSYSRTPNDSAFSPEISLVLKQKDGQVRCFFTTALVFASLHAKYSDRASKVSSVETGWRAMQSGLRHEVPILEAMGIRGLVDTGGKPKFSNWKGWTMISDKAVEKLTLMRR